MKKLMALIVVGLVWMASTAQQQPSKQAQPPQPAPKQEQAKTPQQPKQPKQGTFKAQGRTLSFFTRGEGALTLRGSGYLVVYSVQGQVQVEGFREVKELPRNVRIKPPLDQRMKVFIGQGTLRIQGKYDSVRGVLRNAQVDFKGVASFDMSGTGTASIDGKQRELTPITSFTMLVPEPNWNEIAEDVKTPPKSQKPAER